MDNGPSVHSDHYGRLSSVLSVVRACQVRLAPLPENLVCVLKTGAERFVILAGPVRSR